MRDDEPRHLWTGLGPITHYVVDARERDIV